MHLVGTALPAAKNCTDCEVGKFSGGDGGATECKSCKANPDTFYAAQGASKCTACVSPLVIASSSQAGSINDCVCPEGTYLSSGTVSISPVCTVCPVGGFCPQGTENASSILAQVGYWRPDKETANFGSALWALWINQWETIAGETGQLAMVE